MPRRWRTTTILLLICMSLLLGGRIWQVQQARARFPTEFNGLRLGMTHGEVERRLCMPPSYQRMMLGRVESPTQFAANLGPLPEVRHLYQEYDFQVWTTPALTGTVVFDREGRVVCKYAAASESRWPRNLYELLRIF